VPSEATQDGGRSPGSESASDAPSDLTSGSATDRVDVGESRASTATTSENTGRLASTEQSVPVNAHVEPEADSAAAPGDGSAIAAAAGAGWQPVPVPPPTYTLKPKAPAPVHRPVAAPAAVDRQPTRPSGSGQASNVAPDDAAVGADSGFDLDQILERRIAAGG
jgi:hypothetical protein